MSTNGNSPPGPSYYTPLGVVSQLRNDPIHDVITNEALNIAMAGSEVITGNSAWTVWCQADVITIASFEAHSSL